MNFILAILCFLCVFELAPPVQAQTTKQPWSDPKTWGGTVPQAGAAVYIPAGKEVLLDVSPPPLKSLEIDGNLSFARKNLNLSADWIMVHGRLRVGAADSPFKQRAVITLTGSKSGENIMGMGTKFIGVMGKGVLEMFSPPRVSWTRLNATAVSGASQLTLERSVDWKAGDRLVVATTDFDPLQSEQVEVQAVSGNVVTLAQSLANLHWGQMQTYDGKNLDERAEVGLLTRNIVVQGDSNSTESGFGGHIMVMEQGQARLDGVELYHMGQKASSGRYPLHMHLLGTAVNTYLKNSSIHHSYNRCVTLHGTNQVSVLANVAYDAVGHCFFLEDGIETKNVFDQNLGLVTRKPATYLIPSDEFPSTFWITNPDNTFTNNVAGGSEGFGFWYDLPEHPTGASATAGANVYPRTTAMGLFKGNSAHSNYAGWQSATGLFVENYTLDGVFEDFTTYKNAQKGIWLGCCGKHTATNARLANNLIGFYGWDATLQNSLVVGKSENPDSLSVFTEFSWNGGVVRGMEEYDGWLQAENVTFVNFVGTGDPNVQSQAVFAGAATISGAHDQGSIYTYFKGSKFINAPSVWYPSVQDQATEVNTYVIGDADGSAEGSGQPGYFVNDRPIMTTNECTAHPEWNAHWCPHSYGFLAIYPGKAQGSLAPLTLVRDDGVSGLIPAWVATNGIALSWSNPLLNRSYKVQPTGQLSNFLLGLNARSEDWIEMSFPYGSTKAYVYAATNYNQPLIGAGSLSEFESSSGLSYFQDTASGVLYVRLPGDDKDAGGSSQMAVCSQSGCPQL